MKNKILTAFAIVALTTTSSFAAKKETKRERDVKVEIDSLGGNDALVERAKLLDTDNQTRIVQKRTVDRYSRIEASFGGGIVTGGDSYMNTNGVNGSLQWHFSPRISLGVSYSKHYNSLTNEGRTVFDEAQRRQQRGDNFEVPDIDYPIQSTMAFVNIYPIYGKLNFFNLGISQFDLYAQVGYGKIELSSGSTDTYSAGGGAGIWWSNYFTTRFETKWQRYSDKVYTGSRQLDLVVISGSIGLML